MTAFRMNGPRSVVTGGREGHTHTRALCPGKRDAAATAINNQRQLSNSVQCMYSTICSIDPVLAVGSGQGPGPGSGDAVCNAVQTYAEDENAALKAARHCQQLTLVQLLHAHYAHSSQEQVRSDQIKQNSRAFRSIALGTQMNRRSSKLRCSWRLYP